MATTRTRNRPNSTVQDALDDHDAKRAADRATTTDDDDGPVADVVTLGDARRAARAARDAQAKTGLTGPWPPVREVLEVPLDQLEADEANVRGELREIDDLATSIASIGIIEPLIVTRLHGEDRYRIIAGHRRRAAATKAGLATVPCLEHTDVQTDTARIEMQLVENLQRDDLTPLEEALAYQALVDAGDTQRKIAERVGRNQSHISKRLKLLGLPDKARAALGAGELTVEDALALSALADHPDHVAAAMADYAKEAEYQAPWPGLMSECVDEQQRIIERQQKRLAAFAELDAAGIRIIDWPKSGYGDSGWPTNHRRIDQTWKWPAGKAPTKAKLKKAGHLAAAVDETGSIVYLCTDAARYETAAQAKSHDGDSAALSAQRAAETRALNKRRRADSKRRCDVAGRFIRNAITGKRLDEVLDGVVAGDRHLGAPISIWVRSMLWTWIDLIGNVWNEPTKMALDLLDVAEKPGWGLLERLAAQPEYAGRLELAVWCALAEQRIKDSRLVDPLVTAYYRWLGALRYELGDEERQDLETALRNAKQHAS